MAQGDYHVKSPSVLSCTAPAEPSFDAGTAVSVGNRYVHGVAGRPRPRIIGDATACTVVKISGAGRAEHLEVIGNNTARAEAAAVVIDGNGSATSLLTGGPNGTVHMRNGARLRNSVAGARPQDGAAVFLHFGFNASAGFITHVTALGSVVADSTSAWGGEIDSHIVCVNSIATGGFVARQTNAFRARSRSSTVTTAPARQPSSAARTPPRPNQGGSIQSATLVPGDYHQAATSPTVNAGRVDPETLALSDIDGGARTVGPLPDIGADEVGAASALVDSGDVLSVSGAAARVAGTVFPGGLPTSAYVEYGPTTGYGSQSAPLVADGFGSVALRFGLTGMTVNSPVYHYRLVGTNGNTRGEDRVIGFADGDGDGFFSNVDCNDGNAAINPGRGDIPDNGVDDDCSGADAINLDRDGDGFPRPLDCDDANAAINPSATDLPGNRTDEDCKTGDAPYPTLTSTLGYATTNYARYTRHRRSVRPPRTPRLDDPHPLHRARLPVQVQEHRGQARRGKAVAQEHAPRGEVEGGNQGAPAADVPADHRPGDHADHAAQPEEPDPRRPLPGSRRSALHPLRGLTVEPPTSRARRAARG